MAFSSPRATTLKHDFDYPNSTKQRNNLREAFQFLQVTSTSPLGARKGMTDKAQRCIERIKSVIAGLSINSLLILKIAIFRNFPAELHRSLARARARYTQRGAGLRGNQFQEFSGK